jgi:hypothetical protein
MITLSNEYSIHFHDLFIDGKENAKMTGDRMKMLTKIFLRKLFVTYDCRTRYSVCVPCILWCYNTKSVPLYVSSIHDFVMVHTGTAWYVLLYFVRRSS